MLRLESLNFEVMNIIKKNLENCYPRIKALRALEVHLNVTLKTALKTKSFLKYKLFEAF